jgi:lactoylglutathione lyase
MELGAFSVSLSVKDIRKSRDFYEKMGFRVFGGNIDENWLILRNDKTVIGLFQGMFESNLLTFNPGWDQQAALLEHFCDVREIKKKLLEEGLSVEGDIEEDAGPASITLTDPDGNVILIDQHV